MALSLRRGIFWLLVSEACYSVMRVATRAGAADLPWAEIAAARFFGGALVAFVAARVQGVSLRVGDQKNAWLRSLSGTLAATCLFYALGTRHVSVGEATVLYSTTPLWVALLSWATLRERVGAATWIGIAIGFVGVAVLLRAGLAWRGPTVLIVLAGAVSYAFALLRLRQLSGHESSEAIALHLSLVAGTILLVIALPAMRPVRAAAYVPLALSALAGGLAQVAVGRAYAHAPAARMSALTYSGVLFTYLLELALFHRAPGPLQIVGSALVVGGGLVVAGVFSRPVPAQAEA